MTDTDLLYEMFSDIVEDRNYETWDKYFCHDYTHCRNGVEITKEDIIAENMETVVNEETNEEEKVLKDVSCIHETSAVANNDSPDFTVISLQYDLLHMYEKDLTRKGHVCAIYKICGGKIQNCTEVIYWEPMSEEQNDDDNVMYV